MQEETYPKLAAELLADFEACLRSRNCRDVNSRLRVVRDFLDSLFDATLLRNPQPTIAAYADWLAYRRLAPETIQKRCDILREFFEHLESSEASEWLRSA